MRALEEMTYKDYNGKEYPGIKINIFCKFRKKLIYKKDYINSTNDIMETLTLLPESILNRLSEETININILNKPKYLKILNKKTNKEIGDYICSDDDYYKELVAKGEDVEPITSFRYETFGFYICSTNHIFIIKEAKKKVILHEIGHFLDFILDKNNNYKQREKYYKQYVGKIKKEKEKIISEIKKDLYTCENDKFIKLYDKEISIKKIKGNKLLDFIPMIIRLIKGAIIWDTYYFSKTTELLAESFAQYIYNNDKFKNQYPELSHYIEYFIKNYDELKYNKIKSNELKKNN